MPGRCGVKIAVSPSCHQSLQVRDKAFYDAEKFLQARGAVLSNLQFLHREVCDGHSDIFFVRCVNGNYPILLGARIFEDGRPPDDVGH